MAHVEPYIDSVTDYTALALRTLATKVAESTFMSTCNAATGLCSEVGELGEFFDGVPTVAWNEQTLARRTHFIKELGDWMWYWALACQCYNIRPADLLGSDSISEYCRDAFIPDGDPYRELVKATGHFNELVKKQYFHFHPLHDVEAGIHVALAHGITAWCQIVNLQGFDPANVLGTNIDKLRKRYPDGFSTEKSMHRAVGDV